MAALTLAQIRAGTRDPAVMLTASTLIKTDQLVGAMPWRSTGMQSLFAYNRRIGNLAMGFLARDASITEDTTFQEVEVNAKTKRVLGQSSVDRANAGDAGGLASLKARKVESALEALGLTVGAKILTGDSNLTATLSTSALTTVTVTDVGPNVVTDRGLGILKYTTADQAFSWRAPGEIDFGTPVVILAEAAATKIYSYNGDRWIEITRAAGSLAANATAQITFSGGTNEFDGVFQLLKGQTSRIIYANSNATDGGALSLNDLDKLEKLVKAPRGNKAFVMGSRTMSSFEALMRAAGGATMTEYQGMQVGAYKGIPVLMTDHMPENQTRGSTSTCSSVICTTFGEEGGLCGYYTEDSEPLTGAVEILRGAMGVSAWDLPVSTTAHAASVRVVSHVAVGNPNLMQLAQLGGVTN